MFTKLYLWVESLAQKKQAKKWLYGTSFIESFFFPIPIDVLLIPVCLQNIKQAYPIAFWTSVFSVLGGLFGYLIGYFAADAAHQVMALLNHQTTYLEVQKYFIQYGVIFVLFAAFSPFPYKIIAIASGIMGLNPFLFILTSIVGRAGRFFLVAFLIRIYGESINQVLRKYTNLIALIFIALIAIYFVYYVS